MAALAASAGGFARIMMSLHGGERRPVALAIDAGLGALLGIMAAGAAVWWDPSLREAGYPFLIVTSAAGLVSAMGLRVLDLVMDALKKKLG